MAELLQSINDYDYYIKIVSLDQCEFHAWNIFLIENPNFMN